MVTAADAREGARLVALIDRLRRHLAPPCRQPLEIEVRSATPTPPTEAPGHER